MPEQIGNNPWPVGSKEHQIWQDGFHIGVDVELHRKAVESLRTIRQNRHIRTAQLVLAVEHDELGPLLRREFRTADCDDCYEQLLFAIADWWSKVRADMASGTKVMCRITFDCEGGQQMACVDWEFNTLEEENAIRAVIEAQALLDQEEAG
jgi:hypothetical protein